MAAVRTARKAAVQTVRASFRERPRAERQQRHQRSGGHELGHGLVGEADQFVPEGPSQQGGPPGGFAEVASAKEVHACRNRQGDGAEQQLDAADVPEGLAESDGVEQK